MASGSYVQVPANSVGVKLATSAPYTEASNSVQDLKVIPGEPYIATYSAVGSQLAAGSNSHLLEIYAGTNLNVRIRRFRISQHGVPAGGDEPMEVRVLRTVTKGSGGTPIVPVAYDGKDAAASATVQSLPVAKGSDGVVLWSEDMWLASSTPLGEAILVSRILDWYQFDEDKPIVIGSNTNAGIAFKTATGSNATLNITAEFAETSF